MHDHYWLRVLLLVCVSISAYMLFAARSSLSQWGQLKARVAIGQVAQTVNQPELVTRNRPAMAYDAWRGQIILFGGAAKTKSAPDVWEWQTDTWSWDGKRWQKLSETGPSMRALPAMVFDSHRKKLVLFGGEYNSTALARLWPIRERKK